MKTIDYSEIMKLGFSEKLIQDQVYYDRYGFDYSLIQFELTDTIYLEWEKEKRLCKMVRVDNKEEQNILSSMPIEDLKMLKEIIRFFKESNSFRNEYYKAC